MAYILLSIVTMPYAIHFIVGVIVSFIQYRGMPTQPARPCNKGQCNGLVLNGVCSTCGSQRGVKDREYDSHRPTATQRGYNSIWQRLRRMQLAAHPLCHDCQAEGLVKMGGEVHHIVAKRNGGEDSLDNLMTLCKSHHSQRTARGE